MKFSTTSNRTDLFIRNKIAGTESIGSGAAATKTFHVNMRQPLTDIFRIYLIINPIFPIRYAYYSVSFLAFSIMFSINIPYPLVES